MKKLLLLFFFLTQVGEAQNKRKIDSLSTLLKETKYDTTKSLVLVELGKSYGANAPDSMFAFSQRAFNLANKINFKFGIGASLHYMGLAKYYRGEYEISMEYYEQAVENRKKVKDKKGMADSFNNIALIYYQRSNYDKALYYNKAALNIREEINDTKGIALSMSNIAIIFQIQDNVDRAIYYHQKALAIRELIKDRVGIAETLNNISAIHSSQKEYDLSLKEKERALQINKELNNQQGIAVILNNMSDIYIIKKEYDKAISCLLESAKISEKIKYSSLLKDNFTNLSISYRIKKEYELSIDYALKSLEIAKSIKSVQGMVDAMEALYNTYKAQGNATEALKYFELAKQIQDSLFTLDKSKALSNLTSTMELERKEKELTLVQKDNELNRLNAESKQRQLEIAEKQAVADKLFALARQEKDKNKADSLQNLAQKAQLETDKLRAIEAKIQAENKNKTLQILKEKSEKEFQQRLNYFILATLLGVTLLAYFIYRGEQKERKSKEYLAIKNAEINQQKEEISVQAENLQLAYQQLQALEHFKEDMLGTIVHDLKNPLNAILHQEEEKKTRTYQIANQMLGLVLNILDIQKFESAHITLDLHSYRLLELTEKALGQVSFLMTDKNIRFQHQIDAHFVVQTDKELLVRVIVNLLTNAIKYTPSNGCIMIYTELASPTQVRYCVQDTGEGIPLEKQGSIFDRFSQVSAKDSGKVKSTGLGLSFCKMVVEAHENCTIAVQSEAGKGAIFCFTLPLVSQKPTEISIENTPTPHDDTAPISAEEIQLILPYIAKIKDMAIFQTSDVIEALSTISVDAPTQMLRWKTAVENAVYNYDEITFSQLKTLA